MTLTDEQLELIESALQRFGVTGLARKIGATSSLSDLKASSARKIIKA